MDHLITLGFSAFGEEQMDEGIGILRDIFIEMERGEPSPAEAVGGPPNGTDVRTSH